VLLAVALVCTLLLAGCAPSEKDPTMTPAESEKSMFALIDATITELGDQSWTDPGVPAARDCTLPSGATGVDYVAVRQGPPSADPEGDVAKVAKFWKAKGIETRVVHSTNPKNTQIRLYGVGGPVKAIDFYADTVGTGLDAESTCVVGDADKILEGSQ
jgi:hypothetical protein